MRSIRTKITLLTVLAIVVTMAVATILGVAAIRDLGNASSDQILFLLCETGKKDLDAYFDRIEQSVKIVSGYAETDLKSTDLDDMGDHMERVKDVFERTASNTVGILTYYYRIDPAVSDEAGFWFVNTDGTGFQEHEVTDIHLYDTEDQSALVWFTVPKATGEPIWLPPYFTENLDEYVLSYDVPIFKNEQFVGVIGIEIQYRTLVAPAEKISLYENGFGFIYEADGTVVYHPHMDAAALVDEPQKVPEELLGSSASVRYTREGVAKQAMWLPLKNGMRLAVTVPLSEINRNWHDLVRKILAVLAVVLLVFILLTMRFAKAITGPLRELTEAAARVNQGDYDFEPHYRGNDEVGTLTRAFSRLTDHLKSYISDLNNLAYADALTSVHNKGSFDVYERELQARIRQGDTDPAFAVGVFDCDDLKSVNDKYGHEKGDLYLKAASSLICQVFHHSPVFRTGGDEFAVILLHEDYRNREALTLLFEEKSDEINAKAKGVWERVSVAIGIAAYDPKIDKSVKDALRRADQLMYENKRTRKEGKAGGSPAGDPSEKKPEEV